MASGLIATTVLTLFITRVTDYPNLMSNEERVGVYVLDVVQSGNWFVQKKSKGEVAPKPPTQIVCGVDAFHFRQNTEPAKPQGYEVSCAFLHIARSAEPLLLMA